MAIANFSFIKFLVLKHMVELVLRVKVQAKLESLKQHIDMLHLGNLTRQTLKNAYAKWFVYPCQCKMV